MIKIRHGVAWVIGWGPCHPGNPSFSGQTEAHPCQHSITLSQDASSSTPNGLGGGTFPIGLRASLPPELWVLDPGRWRSACQLGGALGSPVVWSGKRASPQGHRDSAEECLAVGGERGREEEKQSHLSPLPRQKQVTSPCVLSRTGPPPGGGEQLSSCPVK